MTIPSLIPAIAFFLEAGEPKRTGLISRKPEATSDLAGDSYPA